MNQWSHLWSLDPNVIFLNHGSFGSCPKVILERQQALRLEMEREPIQFMVGKLPSMLDEARAVLGQFIGADPKNLAFVPNATTGVNSVLRSLSWAPGDELLTTNHAYNACKNALHFVAERHGATVVVADIPFPLQSSEQVLEAVMDKVTPRTKLALLDHITSPTALVFPIRQLITALAAKGVETLVDGAHAPGMVPLQLDRLGATYYTGNCHKWLCAPKGAGFLWVHPDKQAMIRPLSISHGANEPLQARSRFHLEFDWTGTIDFSPYICLADVIPWMEAQIDGGWPALMQRNHQLTLESRQKICALLDVDPPAPDDMIGFMASIPLPDAPQQEPPSALAIDPFQRALLEHFAIQIPIYYWPKSPKRFVRFSTQLYNSPEQYDALGLALQQLLQTQS